MIVAKFLSWIETAPVEKRAEATSALARAFLFSSLEPDEKKAAETALTIMLDDPAPVVRVSLAHAFSSSPFAPRQIILTLAQDCIDVAAPVLCASPILMDSELIDMIGDGSEMVQCAIAIRPSVPATLSAALAEVAGLAACLAMLNNPGAQVTTFSLRRLAERFGHEAEMRNSLLALPGLPVDIRQTLIVQLGGALERLSLVQNFVSSERRGPLVKDACDKATVDLAFCCARGDELSALVEHLRLSGQLNADFLIRGLCMGNLELFSSAMVVLTGMSESRVKASIADPNPNLIRTLCKKADIPERAAPVIYSALCAYHDLQGKTGAWHQGRNLPV